MAPWTPVAAYEHGEKFLTSWTAIKKKALPQCDGDTSSCLGPYPRAICPKFHIGSRLGENFTLPTYNGRKVKLESLWDCTMFITHHNKPLTIFPDIKKSERKDNTITQFSDLI